MTESLGAVSNTPTELVMLVAYIVAVTLFMPATAVSFLGFRLRKKKSQFHQLLRRLGLNEGDAQATADAVEQEYAASDYLLPVGFATLITLVGSYTLILGGETLVVEGYNLVLQGMNVTEAPWSDNAYLLSEWRRFIVLGFAFLGGYIHSAHHLVRRLVTADLSPGTYYDTGLRISFAMVAALMLSYFVEVFPGSGYPDRGLPVLAFLAGVFPDRALRYLREKVRIFARDAETSSHELPLGMIEGMNVLHRTRLAEVGIDNAQNLAEAELIDLVLRTPFPPTQILDWIAQAKLFVCFKDRIEGLRSVGIRT
ncbi:MAG TPA: hypothetical protein VM599_10195, partial [Thermoanaerobaculia bacterium]|nr:hypothetical protein [Thermoanaerobaculia bacterium]